MIKLSELLSIEKDINILEKHGYYKSAKILHDKFTRIAQQNNSQTSNIYTYYLNLIDTAIRSTNSTLLGQYHNRIDDDTSLNDAQKQELQKRIETFLYSKRPAAVQYSDQEQQVTQQQVQPNQTPQQGDQKTPVYTTEIETMISNYNGSNAPSSIASLLNFIAIRMNIGLPQAVDILASKNFQIAGKPLATHVNLQNLKQTLASITPSRGMNYNQLGQVVMNGLTDYKMSDGTPIKLTKYERLGLFRSTPEQEAVYLAQKIRHIQSGDAVPKSALLPRV
jgi:hypothetical protein